MQIHWMEQTEADVPAGEEWLSASEALRSARHLFCQTAQRLALGTLDGEESLDRVLESSLPAASIQGN